ncbi:hypothetical protein JCM5353_008065 [Sporobolomyces roseus]
MASTPPSRSASSSPPIQMKPSPSFKTAIKTSSAVQTEKTINSTLAVGRNDAAFYRKMMPGWRCRLRELLVESLEGEIEDLVQLQTTWRTRFRDHYFVKTSLLGTHTFFMVFIPIWAWYGFPEVARGLLYVLAAGGYVTSVLKDAFCVPRPFSPPVIRLSVGSHALEYGFPSTHSSNALSMALFFGELLLRRNKGRWIVNSIGVGMLFLFAWSITFGRLYTGMHSRMDVKVGASIGVLVWLVTWLGEAKLEEYVIGSGLTGTLFIVPVTLLLVTFHPQPAENCPCFEDAIAFLSVFAGILLGIAWNPYKYADNTLGFLWRDVTEVGIWTTAVLSKLIIGVSGILVWRIIAKFICHQALPPVFRFFAPIISLPRRYYLSATEYDSYPEQKHLNPVPSILDLPSLASDAELSSSSALASSSSSSLRSRPNLPHSINDGTASSPHSRSLDAAKEEGSLPQSQEVSTHIDADVLTKIFVYAGIGWGATVTLPWLFAVMGLSVWEDRTISGSVGRRLVKEVVESPN